MKIRIATFNVENLFNRFNFSGFEDVRDRGYLPEIVQFLQPNPGGDLEAFSRFRSLVETANIVETDEKRQHTALALSDADADIVCMQEVDSIEALRKFQQLYLSKSLETRYYQTVLHEANDPRGIDNAVMAVEKVGSKELLLFTRSNAHMRVSQIRNLDALVAKYPALKPETKDRGDRIFSRDCLETQVQVDGKTLTLFVCHFKSMSGGRDKTMGRRQLEALAVRQIIEDRFPDPSKANWVILGDLNDYWRQIRVGTVQAADGNYPETVREWHTEPEFQSGLDPLLRDGFAISLADAIPVEDRWSHYYAGDRTKTQLDHMLASPAVAEAVVGVPKFIRGGQPFRVPNTKAIERYPRLGWDRPKASDHCPLVVELDVARLA